MNKTQRHTKDDRTNTHHKITQQNFDSYWIFYPLSVKISLSLQKFF